MRLSVHDLLAYKLDEQPEEAYQRTKAFVKEIEALNYTRYWFAEHHNTPNYGSVSPELLAAHMSAVTDRIRLGTGGTMIMHYSPLKIAENIKTMEALAPGRADIGLGRAPGSGPHEIVALAQGKPDSFSDLYDKIEIILKYLADEEAPGIYGRTHAMPQGLAHLPQPWMLGSSGQSALKTAEMGLGYSFAKFFGVATDPEVFQLYRYHFQPSVFFDQPEVIVSYVIVVADSREEAMYHAKPIIMNLMAIQSGKVIPIYSPEAVRDHTFNQAEQAFINNYLNQRFMIVGDKAEVEAILTDEIETLGIDEVMVYAPIHDDQARLKSYRYLAEIFDRV